MADAQGPNMSREWNLEFGNRLLGIIREERNTTMATIAGMTQEGWQKAYDASIHGGKLFTQVVRETNEQTGIQINWTRENAKDGTCIHCGMAVSIYDVVVWDDATTFQWKVDQRRCDH